jgi:predicted ribosome quality control (RQC) complex YloA/Tae2 family protein
MGRIALDIGKTVHENAARYYQRAKELRKKAQGADKAIEQTRREMAEAGREKPPEKKVRIKREKKWYERYHWFESGGFLVLAGRDAKQNEELVSKRLEDQDLFMHADIRGAPATVVKNGLAAPESVLLEAAQFAASYSSAWKAGQRTVDVYAVEKSQVSKEASGEYLGKGSFVISGKRRWFKNVGLGLSLGVGGEGFALCAPALAKTEFKASFSVSQGEKEKGEAAREAAVGLGVSVDEILSLLPAGKFECRRVG